jgi:hypothetical protein
MIRKQPTWALSLLGIAAGLVVGWAATSFEPPLAGIVQAQQAQGQPAVTLETLAAEIETLKGRLPDQAHAMVDVGYHFANLWFSGQHENWKLAEFNLAETKSHLRWAVRIIPKRKVGEQEVDLQAILQSLENAPLAQLAEAIAAQDKPAFEKAYRFTLESCYACHKASDKAFIRPQIPASPDVHVLNFDPAAQWPR